MADPAWKSIVTDYPEYVEKLSSLIGDTTARNLLDHLVASSLLQIEQRTKIDAIKDKDEAARELLIILKRKGPGSFNKFCIAIRKTDSDEGLYRKLIGSCQSSAYGTDAVNSHSLNDPRSSYMLNTPDRHNDLETQIALPPQMSLQSLQSEIWKAEREKVRESTVFVNLFLKQFFEKEWTMYAACCHTEEERKKEEDNKKNWKPSESWWQFPLNNESENKVRIQLADIMKDDWFQEEDIVFDRLSLMGSANSSQRITAKRSPPEKSLHFKAKYEKDDGTATSVNTFSFLFSPASVLPNPQSPPEEQEEEQKQKQATGLQQGRNDSKTENSTSSRSIVGKILESVRNFLARFWGTVGAGIAVIAIGGAIAVREGYIFSRNSESQDSERDEDDAAAMESQWTSWEILESDCSI